MRKINQVSAVGAATVLALTIGCQPTENPSNWYPDEDGDNYGAGAPVSSVGEPTGPASNYVENDQDCDDNDGNNFPGNTEVADGLDNNCDDVIDDGFAYYYPDTDGDGFGDENDAGQFLDQAPANHVADNTDCDDSDGTINPGAIETDVNDAVDMNCNGYSHEKYLFVTSSVHSANVGGLGGADAICQGLANASSLPPGVYKAWLSDETTNAVDRLNHSTIPYVRPDNELIALDWDALIASGPVNGPEIDELGAMKPGQVWSGTALDGTFYAGWPGGTATGSCNGWTDDDAGSAYNTTVGLNFTGPGNWTAWSPSDCDGPYHYYCIQQ